MSRVLTVIGAQLCWWGCVLLAGTPWALAAVVGTGLWVVLHVARSRQPRSERTLVVVTTLLGVVVDSALVAADAIAFPTAVALGPLPTPLWMIALWTGFATMLTTTLAPVLRSRPLSLVFGVVGGPLSYLGGSRLGPITIVEPLLPSLALVAAAWGLAMVVLSLVQTLIMRSTTTTTTTTGADAG
jgi:hypothetical protein